MLHSFARSLFGTANDRYLKKLQPLVQQVNALEESVAALSDAELQGRTHWFKERIAGGESLEKLLPEAFATVREAGKRVLGMRHFDVQILGGIVLFKGMIAEMKTGEGKTLVSTLPAYLYGLTGKGVHVVTVNDYLAKRDSAWMGKIFEFLGLTVGCIAHEMNDEQRQEGYGCDITYATNNELGFDYLRDNMKYNREGMVQRLFHYAIIDEVDSILIDEARTPLIISGPTQDNSELYIKINALIPKLKAEDIEKDEKAKSVTLTEDGTKHMEALLTAEGMLNEGGSLYDIDHVSTVHHVNQALKAHNMFTRDVDYIVKDNKVVIIDEFTGRMMEGRRYSEGLHQALEAKENVVIQNENQTLASITFQNFFRLYPKLSGMTGTAMTEAGEFQDIYGLSVIEVPTNVPVARIDSDDEIYRTALEKYEAIIRQIAECYMREQPTLVGTVSIEKSEYLSKLLSDKKYFRTLAERETTRLTEAEQEFQKLSSKKQEELENEMETQRKLVDFLVALSKKDKPIPHQVLNARYHEKEAHIVAQAGRLGAITIATNMAGRGTDIMLGGNPDMLIADQIGLKENGEPVDTVKAEQLREDTRIAKEKVRKAGGLYVIASERHESRRIDNQLRGRSGRQGDPGASKFFISLEDDLMRIFGSERLDGLLQRLGLQEGEAIFHPMMTRAIERAQTKVEGRNYEIRKNLLKYDDVMNDQRKVIYEQRIELMETDDVSETIEDMRVEVNQELVLKHIPPKAYHEDWDLEGMGKDLYRIYGLHLPVKEWGSSEGIADTEILERIEKETAEHMQEKQDNYGENIMRMAEKRILLQTLDQLWKDHLLSLDHLRQGINWRAYGQRDPLNEYKQEAFSLFEHMLYQLREATTARMAHLEVVTEPPANWEQRSLPQNIKESRANPIGTLVQPTADAASDAAATHHTPIQSRHAAANVDPADPTTWGRVGRNDACPCGSGKKFKYCHGKLG